MRIKLEQLTLLQSYRECELTGGKQRLVLAHSNVKNVNRDGVAAHLVTAAGRQRQQIVKFVIASLVVFVCPFSCIISLHEIE